MQTVRQLWTAAAIFPLAVAGPATAGEEAVSAAPSISIELNSVETHEAGCRITFMAKNGLPGDAKSLVLETVLFTRAGEVERMTLFDMGALPAGRPRVRQFDVGSLDCADLGRVLINEVATCEGDGLDPDTCLDVLRFKSRLEVELLG